MFKYRKNKRKEISKEAKSIIPEDQKNKCRLIIHSAATASGAVGAVPIPIADALPISAIQTSMVICLGKTFGKEIDESTAKGLICSAASTLAGRSLARFIPGIGWMVSAGVAAVITETIGWSVAIDFAKADYAEGHKDGYNDASDVYETKLSEQAKNFESVKESWSKAEHERDLYDEEMQKHISHCHERIRELEKTEQI